MPKSKCKLCDAPLKKDEVVFLEDMFGPDFLVTYDERKKGICNECKKEMMFAGILAVVR